VKLDQAVSIVEEVQTLRESASVLPYTYIVCLVIICFNHGNHSLVSWTNAIWMDVGENLGRP